MKHDFTHSAMIALLPMTTNWCQIEFPHMTLVFAGEEEFDPVKFNDLAKDAATVAMLSRPISLDITGQKTFGDEHKVDVFGLRYTPELYAMRKIVERWNQSKHDFSPHVTVRATPDTPSVLYPPSRLTFDRIMTKWGNEEITFWLNRSNDYNI